MASFALVPYAVAQKTGGRAAGAPARYVIVRRFLAPHRYQQGPRLPGTERHDYAGHARAVECLWRRRQACAERRQAYTRYQSVS